MKSSWNAALGLPCCEEAQATIWREHMEENEGMTVHSPSLAAIWMQLQDLPNTRLEEKLFFNPQIMRNNKPLLF